jgi:ribosomal protein S18 acetylase RimI-like enzyme
LRLEALKNEPFAFGKAPEEHESTTVESLAARFRDVPPGNFYLGAFRGHELIGMATFVREAGLKEKHKGRIYGVYVTFARRQDGVGRALLETLIESAKQDESLKQILLAVTTCQEAAKRLYQSFGFELYGTEPNALRVGSRYLDEDEMILLIR